MPFTSPWAAYQAGDLLYGLAGPRVDLAAHFGLADHYTIDEYDIASYDRGGGASGALQYDPNFRDALRNHAKYASVVADGDLGWDLSDNAHWAADHSGMLLVAKRKCKGGLEWITRHTMRNIHFCLDGLNLRAAASKTYDGLSGGVADNPQGKAPLGTDPYNKPRSITGAELRWIYRNRLDVRVQNRVQFWRRRVSWATGARTTTGWEGCPPPWTDPAVSHDTRAAWAAYVPTTAWVPPPPGP